MFAPTGNGEFRLATAAGLRAFLWEATIPAERIDEALDALRTDTDHALPTVKLTRAPMRTLGLRTVCGPVPGRSPRVSAGTQYVPCPAAR
jgi:hypothetical protein